MSATRTLLCFGDSNTHGTLPMAGPEDRRRLPFEERWPSVMAGALGPGWRVIDEGHPGRTTVHDDPIDGEHKNGLRVLPALLETHRPLDMVVVMLGTNDLKGRFAVGPDDIAAALGRLVGVIRTAQAGPSGAAPDVVLVAPVPVEEAGWLAGVFAGGAAKARALAPAIARVAQRLGTGFVDAGPLATVDPLDGVHLTAAAHAAIGRAIADAVRARMS